MENFLKDKKVSTSVLILIVIVCLFVFVKFINEVKVNKYVGRDAQSLSTISVSGSGEVVATSNIATLTLNLERDAVTSKEAQANLNDLVTKVLKYLKDNKIEDKDVKSEFGGVSPKYSYDKVACYTYPCPSNDPKITGYAATQSIVVKIREVDNANTIRTGLTDIGVMNMSGPNFSIDDEEGYKDEARALAIKEAREKARILAKDLGVSLDRIVSFSENNGGNYPMYEAKAMSLDTSAGSAPVLPKGENKVTSNVTITYEIR